MALTRISLTIPAGLLKDLDKKAKALDRSRSRVIVDAVKQYLAARAEPAAPTGRVSEPAATAYGASLVADARASQLRADLALPPTERLRRAEELTRLAPRRSHGKRHQLLAFDTYDDYYEWKKTRNVVP